MKSLIYINPLKYYIKRIFFFFKSGKVIRGNNSIIENGAIVDPGMSGSIKIGNNCYIHTRAILRCSMNGKIIIGNNVTIHPYCVLYGYGDLIIGDDVSIATHTIIVPANHNFSNPGKKIKEQGITKKGITIEGDVWIGANVIILDGVHIGKHSVIGSGSIVTSDVPPFSLSVGVPAKVIRKI